jgi:hypothetical protein
MTTYLKDIRSQKFQNGAQIAGDSLSVLVADIGEIFFLDNRMQLGHRHQQLLFGLGEIDGHLDERIGEDMVDSRLHIADGVWLFSAQDFQHVLQTTLYVGQRFRSNDQVGMSNFEKLKKRQFQTRNKSDNR